MMKRQVLTIAVLIIALSLVGQAQEKENKEKNPLATHNDFKIDLGTNNLLTNGKFPDGSNTPYTVKPLGSWYIALKSVNYTPVGGALHLLWGADVSWYNFKFENKGLRINKSDDGLIFSEAANDVYSKKSKLTVAYIDASLVPTLKFGEVAETKKCNWSVWDNSGFRIGAGAYAGYKIGSYTKVVKEENGDKKKNKDHDGYYLNSFRYGLRFQAGFHGLDVFVNYDLNELFAEGKGPRLNAFSFGVVL